MIWENQRSPVPIPVRDAARFLGVSKSGYYSWLKRKGYDSRAARDRPVVEEMMKIVTEKAGYGYRRMTKELDNHMMHVNHKRVYRGLRPF